PSWIIAVAAVAAFAALAPGRTEPALSLWPSANGWPDYAAIVRGTRLDDLWTALGRAPAGRILFLRSSVPPEFRREWWRPHSHVTALTPVATGREILNGTFTHPSPVAGFVYAGSASAPIDALVERRDGMTLFGLPLSALGPAEFATLAERLRI